MFTLRDAIYLAALALVGALWYTDRSVLDLQLRYTRAALATEQANNDALEARLIEASK